MCSLLALGVRLAPALVLAAGSIRAQTLVTLDSSGAFPPLVGQFTGPPFGPCLYPNGPLVAAFPALGGPCPGLGPVVPPLGDVADDPIGDLVFVSDGLVIAGYTALGMFLGSYPSPVMLTGMGYDALAGLLWVTDGFAYAALPPPLACMVAPPPPVIGPFPVPFGVGLFGAPINDIDWDASTGSLWACDGAGVVGNFLPGPVPLPGPFGWFPVVPGACLPLVPGLDGIVVDATMPGAGVFYVTDGMSVAHMLPGGALAAPSFHTPISCFPLGLPTAGLAFAGRQITFGMGADSSGIFPAPTIGSVGQSYTGNPAYGITLGGTVPGGTGFLLYSFGALCPAPMVYGGALPIYLGPPRFSGGIVPVGAGGGAALFTALPAALPPGLTINLQWIVLTGAGSVQVTSGGHLTVIFP